jgi:hypothetical protein
MEMNEVSIETDTVTTRELKVLNDDVLNTFETIKLQTDNSNKIDQQQDLTVYFYYFKKQN